MAADKNTYRRRVAWDTFLCLVVGLMSSALWIGFSVILIKGARYALASSQHGPGDFELLTHSLIKGWALLAAFALLGGWLVYLLIRTLLATRRCTVVTAPEGVVVTDWRGRRKQIPWDRVTGVTLKRWAGLPVTWILRTRDGDVRLEYSIINRSALLQEIVERANLMGEPKRGYVRP